MAKTDMERDGLFTEVGYTTIGDPYVPPNSSECSGSEYVDYLSCPHSPPPVFEKGNEICRKKISGQLG